MSFRSVSKLISLTISLSYAGTSFRGNKTYSHGTKMTQVDQILSLGVLVGIKKTAHPYLSVSSAYKENTMRSSKKQWGHQRPWEGWFHLGSLSVTFLESKSLSASATSQDEGQLGLGNHLIPWEYRQTLPQPHCSPACLARSPQQKCPEGQPFCSTSPSRQFAPLLSICPSPCSWMNQDVPGRKQSILLFLTTSHMQFAG